jgi:hypothetical protein
MLRTSFFSRQGAKHAKEINLSQFHDGPAGIHPRQFFLAGSAPWREFWFFQSDLVAQTELQPGLRVDLQQLDLRLLLG